MYNNAVLPIFHHLPNDRGAPDPLTGVHRESKTEESDSEADTLRGLTDYLPDTRCPRQDSHPPNALAESVHWETDPTWILGMINPPPQEVLGGTRMFDAALGAYPPYSVGPTLLHHSPFLIQHLRVHILTRAHRPPPANPYLRPRVDPHRLTLFDRWPTR
jgi:hypothetical protein